MKLGLALKELSDSAQVISVGLGCCGGWFLQCRLLHAFWQVDAREELAAGSEAEIEIRACTIEAVEVLKRALQDRSSRDGCPVPHNVQLDWFLWERGERERDTAPPHHRTRTTFY